MKKQFLLVLALLLMVHAVGQSISDFQSVVPTGQTENFVIPATHRYQVLIQSGDTLSAGGHMPFRSDFTGYVPIGGSSEQGYLSINAEETSGGVSVLDLQFNPATELWQVTAGERVDLSAFADSGLVPTARNCSGGLTPWGTVVSCEELESFTDLDSNGYFDLGWSIEIDPVTRTAVDQDGDLVPDKLWALGHMRHENAAFVADSMTVYQGEDNAVHGFLYKFVCDQKAQLGSGRLYALRRLGNGGEWLPVPNTTQWDRNRTTYLADSLGATPFFRVEDVEIGPEGKIYFASTAAGRVYRFRDHGATISHFDTFVDYQSMPIEHRLGTAQVQFSWPDNLAFDGDGNLWVMQDGGGNHIWVVGPGHTATQPDARIFANTVLGSEPTGITFSPDFRFLFMSIQHPLGSNTVPMTDASGNTIVFNRDATLVIARAEHLGSPMIAGLPTDTAQMAIFPNPAHDHIDLQLVAAEAGSAKVTLVEMLGRVSLYARRELVTGTNRLSLDIAALPAGHYQVVVEAASGRWVATLVKE